MKGPPKTIKKLRKKYKKMKKRKKAKSGLEPVPLNPGCATGKGPNH